MDFPLSLRICADMDNDWISYQQFGYVNKRAYLRGMNYYNDTIVGWAGHASNGSIIAPVKGFYILKVLMRHYIISPFYRYYFKY